jgi:hypothetical protein
MNFWATSVLSIYCSSYCILNVNNTGLVVASFFTRYDGYVLVIQEGIHATACLLLAYFRTSIFKFSFGLSYEYQTN